ncbi:MAG TPA: ABC transporter substrate-binding protein [Xanthobacteraceae bacterium]|jgi:NitT/TauT family transport system substrate-binding protein|nr:ABC transporter substrate-binding protein [Xanthobacteraceae bacterium]
MVVDVLRRHAKNPRALVLSTFVGGLCLALLGAVTDSMWNGARAESKDVKLMMDWIIQGTHAPFFIAQKNGYFTKAGVTVDAIDAGKGATNVAVSVASGAYQFGWVDLPSMIRFNAMNPSSPLIAVYISFDDTPLAVVTRADAGIRRPADLNGKKIAGGPGTAVHDLISVLLKAAHTPDVNVDWVNVQPQLFGPMLKRGEVDGTGGFTNSNVPAALEVGFKMSDLFVLKYSDFGADMYGLALVTTKQFADENPDTVKGVVAALNHGTKDTIADPGAALALMQARDPMMKMDIEKVRLGLALDLMKTKHVVDNGLSVIDPKKLQFTVDSIADAYKLPSEPNSSTVYTDKFLPPLAERKL